MFKDILLIVYAATFLIAGPLVAADERSFSIGLKEGSQLTGSGMGRDFVHGARGAVAGYAVNENISVEIQYLQSNIESRLVGEKFGIDWKVKIGTDRNETEVDIDWNEAGVGIPSDWGIKEQSTSFGAEKIKVASLFVTYRSLGAAYYLVKAGVSEARLSSRSDGYASYRTDLSGISLSLGLGGGVALSDGISVEAEYTSLIDGVNFSGIRLRYSF